MSESGGKRPRFLLLRLYLNSKGWTCCISANVSYRNQGLSRSQSPQHPNIPFSTCFLPNIRLSFLNHPECDKLPSLIPQTHHVFLMTPITDVQRQTLV